MDRVRVLAYNVWLKDVPFASAPLIDERIPLLAEFIGSALANKEYDIAVLSEAFKYRELLLELKRVCPALNHTPPIPAHPPLHPYNGGILILTTHPIKRTSYTVFEDRLFPDSGATKGVVYAEIDVWGTMQEPRPTLHIFGTHLQSNEFVSLPIIAPADDVTTRRHQLARMRQFIDEVWPGRECAEPVIVAGDFNINRGTPEYDQMRQILSAQHGPLIGLPNTIDPDNTWNKNKAPEFLDYVMVCSADHFKKVTDFGTHETLRRQGDIMKHMVDLSDHHPVAADIGFEMSGRPNPNFRVTISLDELRCIEKTEMLSSDETYLIVEAGFGRLSAATFVQRYPTPDGNWDCPTGAIHDLNDLVLFDRELNHRAWIRLTIREEDDGITTFGDDVLGVFQFNFEPIPIQKLQQRKQKRGWWYQPDTVRPLGTQEDFLLVGSGAKYELRGLKFQVVDLTPNPCDDGGIQPPSVFPCPCP